jgi:hypothetical protein
VGYNPANLFQDAVECLFPIEGADQGCPGLTQSFSQGALFSFGSKQLVALLFCLFEFGLQFGNLLAQRYQFVN